MNYGGGNFLLFPPDHGEQHSRGVHGDPRGENVHAGETRIERCGQRTVVESDHAELFRQPPAVIVRPLEHAGGGQVVPGEDGGRRFREGEQRGCSGVPAGIVSRAGKDQCRIEEPFPDHVFPIGGFARVRIAATEFHDGDKPDAPVAEPGQVIERLHDAAPVIDDDRRMLMAPVGQYGRIGCCGENLLIRKLWEHVDDRIDHAVRNPADEFAAFLNLPRFTEAESNRISRFSKLARQFIQQCDRVRILELVDHNPDQPGGARRQHLCRKIRLIPQLGNGGVEPPRQFRADSSPPRESMRNRALGDFQVICDILYRGSFRQFPFLMSTG